VVETLRDILGQRLDVEAVWVYRVQFEEGPDVASFVHLEDGYWGSHTVDGAAQCIGRRARLAHHENLTPVAGDRSLERGRRKPKSLPQVSRATGSHDG
jgi:hypothetical protein